MLQQGWIPANFQLPPPATIDNQIPQQSQEDEIAQETQEPQTPQSILTQPSNPNESSNPKPTQHGKKKRFEHRAKALTWTQEEELALASAWVEVSKDFVVGNTQSGDSFWGKVEMTFYKYMQREKYRKVDQINTKFKDLNKKVAAFGAIYNDVLNSRQGEANEADILKTAYIRYREENKGLGFKHEQVWDILKKCPKWKPVPTTAKKTSSRASKRSKTFESSDACVNLNDNNEEKDDDDDEDVEIEEPQRPIGKNKGKMIVAGSATTGSTASRSSVATFMGKLDEFNVRVDNQMSYKIKKLELKQQQLQLQQQKMEMELVARFPADFEFFCSPHDNLTGDKLVATLAQKEKIRKMHNF